LNLLNSDNGLDNDQTKGLSILCSKRMNNVDLTTLLIYTVMFFSFCTAKQKRTKRKSSSLKTLRAALTLKLQRARVALLVDDGLV
jgi:hypothetical protein